MTSHGVSAVHRFGHRHSRAAVGAVALFLPAVLMAGIATAPLGGATAAAEQERWVSPRERPVGGRNAVYQRPPADPVDVAAFRSPERVRWPAAGSAVVDIDAGTRTQ